MLRIRPITLREANAFVNENHRHNGPSAGHKFSISVYDGDRLCGVAICGRPISRMLDDGKTIEALRVCTDGTRNACSFLYGACARIAREFGYQRIITYILESEDGTSLRASGWTKEVESCGGGSWSRQSRKRESNAPVCKKRRYEKRLTEVIK